MSTLLLRLAAPMQAWGAGSKFEKRRDTQRLPTKSGVIGMIASALGRRRFEGVADLNALIMGARADQEGELLRDYHTALKGSHGAGSEAAPYVTNRYYLCDAVFLVGLQGDLRLLTQIETALKTPVFPLFLGRRSCPPEGRVSLGIREGLSLTEALSSEPWQAAEWYQQQNQNIQSLLMMLEAQPGTPGSFYLRDAPLSFDQARRMHGFRCLRTLRLPLPRGGDEQSLSLAEPTAHNPFTNWGE